MLSERHHDPQLAWPYRYVLGDRWSGSETEAVLDTRPLPRSFVQPRWEKSRISALKHHAEWGIMHRGLSCNLLPSALKHHAEWGILRLVPRWKSKTITRFDLKVSSEVRRLNGGKVKRSRGSRDEHPYTSRTGHGLANMG